MAATIEGPARKLLEAPNFAYIGTVRSDGSPQVNPVWVDIEDGHVVLNSAEGRAWPKRLREQGVAAVTVPDKDNPYEYVSIAGRLVEDTHEGAEAHIDRMAQKYLGQNTYPWRQPNEERA